MRLKIPVRRLETRRLVYAKYLLFESSKYLENNLVESYYNLSVVLSANAVEILCHLLVYCIKGKDRSDDPISMILKSLRKTQDFPFSEFTKAIRSRNAIYHTASMHTYSTCVEIHEIAIKAFRELYKNLLGVDYDTISLVDLVKSDSVRTPLKEAEMCLKRNDFIDAVVNICEGFARLESRIHKRSHHQMPKHPGLSFNAEISWKHVLAKYIGLGNNKTVIGEQNINSSLMALSHHIDERVNEKISALARYFNFLLMLGSAYEDYKHYESLCPVYHVTIDGKFHCERATVDSMNYTKDQVQFMFDFVLRTTLEIEPKLKPIEVRSLSKKVIQTIE